MTALDPIRLHSSYVFYLTSMPENALSGKRRMELCEKSRLRNGRLDVANACIGKQSQQQTHLCHHIDFDRLSSPICRRRDTLTCIWSPQRSARPCCRSPGTVPIGTRSPLTCVGSTCWPQWRCENEMIGALFGRIGDSVWNTMWSQSTDTAPCCLLPPNGSTLQRHGNLSAVLNSGHGCQVKTSPWI